MVIGEYHRALVTTGGTLARVRSENERRNLIGGGDKLAEVACRVCPEGRLWGRGWLRQIRGQIDWAFRSKMFHRAPRTFARDSPRR
jgi:hypothetical protein